MALTQGHILSGRYRIVKLLSKGGFGTVYRAWDINLKRACAIKENLEVSSEVQHQFELEAHLLSNLSHPNLPRVTDYFSITGQGQYLVMDFVEGEDLQTMLERRRSPFPEAQILPWILQVCEALIYLHLQNPPIIHRDIKPANIKITPQGKAMLVDFGIAKVFDPVAKTTRGARAVTPGYSPTEQYGQGKTDPRSDIYALGATLYTLLTGQEPVESVQRNLNIPLSPPRSINPNISPNVEKVILRALEILPASRYQGAPQLKAALLQVQRPQVVITRPLQRRKIVLWAAIGTPVLIFFFYQIIPLISSRANPTPTPTMTFTPAATLLLQPTAPSTATRTLVTISTRTATITITPSRTPTRTPSFSPTLTSTPTPAPTRPAPTATKTPKKGKDSGGEQPTPAPPNP